MKKKILNYFYLSILISLLMLIVACGDNTSENGVDNNNNDQNIESNSDEEANHTNNNNDNDVAVTETFSKEEATVKVATPWGEEYFMDRVGEFVEEAEPHLTLEHIDWHGSTEGLEELYAENIVPDIFLPFTGQGPLEDTDSVFDLDPLIESYGIDLSHIMEEVIDVVRSRDADGRLVGIPQEMSAVGLYYNKEIFDLFGVEYPDPDTSITWDEVMEMAAALTREQAGTKYCGLEMTDLEGIPLSQLAVNKTDPETGEVFLTEKDEFTRYMGLMDRFYSIPGNDDEDCSFVDLTTAMKIGWQGVIAQWSFGETIDDTINHMKNIDIAPVPVWSDLPGTTITPGTHPWAINAHSENKDAALQFIISATSEEYQTELARHGTPAPSSTGEPNLQFGANNPRIRDTDKNIQALFENTPATPPERMSNWDQYVEFDFEEFVDSGVDIQEFLRTTQEEAEIAIEEAKAQQ